MWKLHWKMQVLERGIKQKSGYMEESPGVSLGGRKGVFCLCGGGGCLITILFKREKKIICL